MKKTQKNKPALSQKTLFYMYLTNTDHINLINNLFSTPLAHFPAGSDTFNSFVLQSWVFYPPARFQSKMI